MALVAVVLATAEKALPVLLAIRPAFRPIVLGGLVALVCGSVAAVALLPAKVSEHARKAEVSATGSQLKIAVTAPVQAPVPAPSGKLATLPDRPSGEAAAAPAAQPAPSPRVRASARPAEEIVVADDDEDVAAPPRYARAGPRWRSASQADEDDAYDPPPADPPARYRPYREEDGWNDRRLEARRFDDRYAASPYLGERYYPPYGR